MSELKDYDIMDIEAMDDERVKTESAPGKWVPRSRVYLKSEVDKVIEFWRNESHKHYENWFNLNKQYEGWFGKVMRCERAERELRRQKYKRCLAMAEMCKARYDEEDAKVNGCGASWEYISKEMKYWERWRNRWLKIAEKFKPNKE